MITVRRRTAAFARIAALFSAAWTALLAVYVLGWQTLTLSRTGEWMPFPISSVLALAGIESAPVYTTASVPASKAIEAPTIAGRLLELPASVVLLVAAVVLFSVSLSAGSVEKRLTRSEQ